MCHSGYISDSSTGDCRDINECEEPDNICGEKATCVNSVGSYWCKCDEGYTNYGIKTSQCTELKCDKFSAEDQPALELGGLANILSMMRTSCLDLLNQNATGEEKAHGDVLLERLFTETDAILSPGPLKSSHHVSKLLSTMENSILLIGPQLNDNITKMETTETEVVIAVKKGKTQPTGPIHLTNENAELHTDWETTTGTGTYPGFALAALLSYKNLDLSVEGSYNELTNYAKDGVDPTFNVSSRVVSVVVSNPSTQHLSRSVNITLRHLEDIEESKEVNYICAYWNERGAWSTDGCYQQYSNASLTVCRCEHLSSFAVLMALYPMEHPFELVLLTKICLIISILCLILSILTFKFCRSIQGTRTTIHLHLCICLFVADVGGCRFVAAMLHYFFLGVFSWMLLEGVQLYRMVVRVFNATIRPLYLYITGYGIPFVIVIISAISRPQGYGTDKHCWLSLEDGQMWSFFGPVCFIIVLNVYFFIITVWKLAQKFTSLNPDLSELHKIKSVREEYAHFLSCICTTPKKRYSDLSTTNPSSSQSQASRSGDQTGESQI
ncbi:hypothetical protein INR49_026411 [Caranx melampygus]|nr:hypothetical protein INR49_026411 [Caranx melampygus]